MTTPDKADPTQAKTQALASRLRIAADAPAARATTWTEAFRDWELRSIARAVATGDLPPDVLPDAGTDTWMLDSLGQTPDDVLATILDIHASQAPEARAVVHAQLLGRGPALEWRSDKARKAAITATTILRPDLNRTEAAALLNDRRTQPRPPGAGPVGALVSCYAGTSPWAVYEATAALVRAIGSPALQADPGPDGTAWVMPGGGITLELDDGGRASCFPPLQHADTGEVTGGWSRLTFFDRDGRAVGPAVPTGLPVRCADPLRIARTLLKILETTRPNS
jgi:hypothetical protein